MLKARIIPCLDVKDGRVVKGINFVDLRDAGDPVEQAKLYDEAGADELVFLDISASHEGRSPLIDIIRKTASVCFIPLTVGGGVRSAADVRTLLSAGADKVAVNTAAVENPGLVADLARKFGNQCITVAVDARKTDKGGYEIFTHGGRRATGIDAIAFAKNAARAGAGELLVTSMDRDGTGEGFDLDLTRRITENVPIPVIASGGVGSLDHLVDGIKTGGASAVLAASIFHYGTYSLKEARAHMRAAGIPVRKEPEQ